MNHAAQYITAGPFFYRRISPCPPYLQRLWHGAASPSYKKGPGGIVWGLAESFGARRNRFRRALRLLTKCGVQGPSRLLNHAHSLTVARMVSLPRFGSLWAFGPSAHRARASLRACRGLGQSPKALCRSIFRERCERPKDARNAALSKTMGFSTV